jgi:hypothetical protein
MQAVDRAETYSDSYYGRRGKVERRAHHVSRLWVLGMVVRST